MSKNIIGIDISDFSIEVVSLEKYKKSFKIESYARFRLSPEIVEDGQILNKEKLKEAILKMFKNAKPVPLDKSYKVFLSIPESQTFSKVLSLPKSIKDKELTKVALNKAEEIIPERISNLTPVVKILSATSEYKKVLYSAVKTGILKDFINIFDELDMEIVGVTTEAISSFAGVKKDKHKKNILFLDLGARTTIASIFTKYGLSSSINIEIGGDNITKAIAKKLNIPYEQAEDKKRQVGLTSDEHGETMLISQGQLQPLVDELKVFIEYWQGSNNQIIDKVILIGGLSQMKGINKYFSDNLNLETELAQSFIDSKDLPKGLSSAKYINALGLAKLAYKDADINFYKKLSKAKNKKKLFKDIFKNIYIWITLAVLILGAGAFLFYNKINSNKDIVTEEIIEEEIFVAIENPEGKDNFITGKYADLDFSKTFIPNEQLEYTEALSGLSLESDIEIIPLLNTAYAQEGYYIIPKIIYSNLVELNLSEEEYVPRESLEAVIEYRFMMFSENALKTYLIEKQPDLIDKINSMDYNIINYTNDGENDEFNISVSIHKSLEAGI